MSRFSPLGRSDVLAFPTVRDAATAAAMDFAQESEGDPPADYFRQWCYRNGRKFGEKAIAQGQAALARELALYRRCNMVQTREPATQRQRGWLYHHGYDMAQTAGLSKKEASALITSIEQKGRSDIDQASPASARVKL